MAISKILVPVDGSSYSQQALEQAKLFAESFGSEIILLHVIDNTNIYPRDMSDKIRQENHRMSTKLLEKEKNSIASLNVKISTIQKEGVPYDEIIRQAEESDVDMIIMGSRGTSGVSRVLMGSVTRKVAVGSEKSVLIVR
ncbi:universal stress protein [Parasporobacterium paucivorans]|uniref:Nucleotide-binding universal stress protein, UspA family n=1 Tax=Parasporobacterium paucivorans DSM 15970 TaxID=1122934 RepID=A0A1M6KHS7_9FIRM|nr:universal stress protein [Parasporobacterium paucivorans]SHJ58465.1 Nucleotide-binding universal stress protein, UspA family [Parasporobacterium paucivorans DSM 15970]